MKTIHLPFGYKLTLERDIPTELGDVLISIDVRERGATTSFAVPPTSINPRAVLLAVVHQEKYIGEWPLVSTMNDIETGLWNSRALAYQSQGEPMAYSRALQEIVEQKSMLTSESDKDVN